MPLDPSTARLLERMTRAAPAGEPETIEQSRAVMREHRARRADLPGIDVVKVEEITIPGPAGPIRARTYWPPTAGTVPTIVYLHGGAFIMGDLDSHDQDVRFLANRAGAVVVSVDYRLAPEYPFPAGYEDSFAAAEWVAGNVTELGGDPARVVLAGDSSGGNFAAALAVECRDRGIPLAAQLLIYPVLDKVNRWPSRDLLGEGYVINTRGKPLINGQYLHDPSLASDFRVSPLHAALPGLPPTVIGIGEYDPLRDECLVYAEMLRYAGVPVVLRDYPGLVHGFFGMAGDSPACLAAAEQLCADLVGLLDRAESQAAAD